MALIKCPECGKEISDKATACPYCGCPSSEFSKYKTLPSDNSDTPASDLYSSSDSSLSLSKISTKGNIKRIWKKIILIFRWCIAIFLLFLAFILFSSYGISGIILFIFLIACSFFVSPLSDEIPIKLPAAVRVIMPIVLFFIAVAFTPKQESQSTANSDDSNELVAASEESQTKVIESDTQDIVAASLNEEITQESMTSETTAEEPVSPVYIEVFDLDLKENWSDYVNEYVRTTFEVDSCDDDCIESTYENGYFKVYPDNYRDFEYGEYITVTGKLVGETATYIEITDAHIENYGSESKSAYESALLEYNERKEIESAEYEASFKEEAEEVSYEDLNRYPDTYKNKRIKITVKITDVEPDGIIFSGHYEAVMSGTNNKIALYDEREVKEPKLLEGDSAIIYGFGDGLTTIKVKDTSGIIAKTVDEYTIPGINIQYVEIN